jgi:hypothetical protein
LHYNERQCFTHIKREVIVRAIHKALNVDPAIRYKLT